MMTSARSRSARSATSAALKLRYRGGVALTAPASPIDLAEQIGLRVQFLNVRSMEGMLVSEPEPTIVLSSARPMGRINFTCAHELGHHWFGHDGPHVDGRSDEPLLVSNEADELQANAFAAALLMPKTTVQTGFARRKVRPAEASPLEVLAVAHWLGVGYTTLVHHLHNGLRLLGAERAAQLKKELPKELLKPRIPIDFPGYAFLVDRSWFGRALDLEVGDVAVLSGGIELSGEALTVAVTNAESTVVSAVAPGIAHVDGGMGWSFYVRVRRRRFAGRSIFRHLEEEVEEGGD